MVNEQGAEFSDRLIRKLFYTGKIMNFDFEALETSSPTVIHMNNLQSHGQPRALSCSIYTIILSWRYWPQFIVKISYLWCTMCWSFFVFCILSSWIKHMAGGQLTERLHWTKKKRAAEHLLHLLLLRLKFLSGVVSSRSFLTAFCRWVAPSASHVSRNFSAQHLRQGGDAGS